MAVNSRPLKGNKAVEKIASLVDMDVDLRFGGRKQGRKEGKKKKGGRAKSDRILPGRENGASWPRLLPANPGKTDTPRG